MAWEWKVKVLGSNTLESGWSATRTLTVTEGNFVDATMAATESSVDGFASNGEVLFTADLAATEPQDSFYAAFDAANHIAPTLLSPTDGATFDGYAPVTFSWQHELDDPLKPNDPVKVRFERIVENAFGYELLPATETIAPTIKTILETQTPRALAFSNDGAWLAIGLSSNDPPHVVIFETTTWTEVARVTSYVDGYVMDLEFSPDDSLLAVAHGVTSGNGITVLNTSNWAEVTSPPSLANYCECLSFNPTGTMLAVSHGPISGNVITVLRTDTWFNVANVPNRASPDGFESSAVVFSKDGNKLAFATYPEVRVINVGNLDGTGWSTGVEITVATTWGLDTSPTDLDHLVVWYAGDAPYVGIYEMSTGDLIVDPLDGTISSDESPNYSAKCKYSPDGTMVALTQPDYFGRNFTILKTDTLSERVGYPVFSEGDPSVHCAFSADGSMLAMCKFYGEEHSVFIAEPGERTEYWDGSEWQLYIVDLANTSEDINFPAESWKPLT